MALQISVTDDQARRLVSAIGVARETRRLDRPTLDAVRGVALMVNQIFSERAKAAREATHRPRIKKRKLTPKQTR